MVQSCQVVPVKMLKSSLCVTCVRFFLVILASGNYVEVSLLAEKEKEGGMFLLRRNKEEQGPAAVEVMMHQHHVYEYSNRLVQCGCWF